MSKNCINRPRWNGSTKVELSYLCSTSSPVITPLPGKPKDFSHVLPRVDCRRRFQKPTSDEEYLSTTTLSAPQPKPTLDESDAEYDEELRVEKDELDDEEEYEHCLVRNKSAAIKVDCAFKTKKPTSLPVDSSTNKPEHELESIQKVEEELDGEEEYHDCLVRNETAAIKVDCAIKQTTKPTSLPVDSSTNQPEHELESKG